MTIGVKLAEWLRVPEQFKYVYIPPPRKTLVNIPLSNLHSSIGT